MRGREVRMADYAHVAMTAFLAVAYGGLLLAGGLLWYLGWKGDSRRLARVGDVSVLLGLWADAVLLTANWLFNWVGWLEARII